MKSRKDKLSKIEIIGRLLAKEINGKSVINLSEETSVIVMDLSKDNDYHYCLYFTNQDKTQKYLIKISIIL